MSFTLTEQAANRILKLIEAEPDPTGLNFRVMVDAGGCSGFQYIFSLDKETRDDDHLFTIHGVTVVVDEASLPFLKESHLDYVEDMMGSSFQVKNPNAKSSCGCGSSFSI